MQKFIIESILSLVSILAPPLLFPFCFTQTERIDPLIAWLGCLMYVLSLNPMLCVCTVVYWFFIKIVLLDGPSEISFHQFAHLQDGALVQIDIKV